MTRPLVVLGDVLLDVDRCGTVDRLSPEAPVPVLRDPVDTRRPGGAALAALLAARSTSRPVVLIAPWADDDAATQLADLLAGQVEVIGISWTGSTPVKTRLRAGTHPLARVDEGGRTGDLASLPAAALAALDGAAAVLVADYGIGATGFPAIRQALQRLSARTPVVWDPHPRGSVPVPGTWCVTPNEQELRVLATGAGGQPAADHQWSYGALAAAADDLAAGWSARSVCITLGSRGAMLCTPDGPPLVVSAPPVQAGDTCGAGDSFAAAVAVALADGGLPSEAVGTAVRAAARFVAQGGAAGVNAAPTATAIPPATAGTDEPSTSVQALLSGVRQTGGTVVATGGCFDLLHAGHVATLEAARALGDCLVVCLNSDASVRRLKGTARPLQPEQDRARVLGALHCVDAVVVFDQDTPSAVLEELRPDVWAKGGDYSGVELPEAAVLRRWGGQVVTVPYLAGRSTTALVELATAPSR